MLMSFMPTGATQFLLCGVIVYARSADKWNYSFLDIFLHQNIPLVFSNLYFRYKYFCSQHGLVGTWLRLQTFIFELVCYGKKGEVETCKV